MRRTPVVTVSALALTLTLTLVGCSPGASDSESDSGSDSSSSTSPAQSESLDATPAAGIAIVGDGYTYSVPEGWEQQDAAAAGADTLALDVAGPSGFATNVNVLLSPAGLITADEVESVVADELEGGGATDVELLDRVTVAGSESAHVTGVLTASDLTYRIHQYYVSDDSQTYVVTFSSSEDEVSDDEAVGIAESVLASWTFN
jgi:hypothetical protein